MLSRSRSAIAGMSSEAHRAISASGSEAPSRKLNADRACSSIYGSVIEAFDKPVPGIHAVINAIYAAIAQVDIPLVTRPAAFCPPFARTAPRTGSCQHISANAGRSNPRRSILLYLNSSGQGWTEHAKGQ